MKKIIKRINKERIEVPKDQEVLESKTNMMLSKASPFQRKVLKRVIKKLKKKYPDKEFPDI